MRKAGKSLKRVLKAYNISQSKLAVAMGVGRSTVHYWFNEIQDPVADAVLEIRKALRSIDPAAADEFIRLYLDESDEDDWES